MERIADVREFVLKTENPPTKSAPARVPIEKLVANGKELAETLQKIKTNLNGSDQLKTLKHSIQPYLQLVTEGARCSETGHLLSDIWRYFRLTWMTPAESTPGRTMLYLIRDAARPFHPIMAISSLENAPFRITPRDRFLGWTPEAFADELEGKSNENALRAFTRLLGFIQLALDDINLSGLCTKEECENPTISLLHKLSGIAAKSSDERYASLRAWRSQTDDTDEKIERSELGNISLDTEKALYKEKRADRLYKLLSAKLSIGELLKNDNFNTLWNDFLSSDHGKGAVRTALLVIKNRHIGTSLLEMNVCGAIPPYNELLAGKLAAILMISPKVVADYKERYGHRPSDIASRMKGEKVIRPANLIFVSTSSLYQIGTSQYNRLKLPAGLLSPTAPEISWSVLGETSGYGTLHISKATLNALEQAASEDGITYVNHIFGEGPSPKLRAIRDALQVVLEPGYNDELTKHAMNRIIFGVWLASNGPAIFKGSEEEPTFYFNTDDSAEETTAKLIDYWIERWLLSRLNHSEIFVKMANFSFENIRISKLLPLLPPAQMQNSHQEKSEMNNDSEFNGNSYREFILNLYRGASSFADDTSGDQLREIHIETKLDQSIIQAVHNGKSVILTGNPGDGKTHLLRVLEPHLKKSPTAPIVELDASAITSRELKNKWTKATKENKPFCAAINVAVLKSLADEYPDFIPVKDAWHQVENTITYEESEEHESNVLAFDLSQRNILSEDIVNAVINKLTDLELLKCCAQCQSEGCDVSKNQRLLRSERFQKRLQRLLDRTSLRGYHATLRELLGLISYLLFAGRSCKKLVSESGNREFSLPQLPYSGKGLLFNAIRETFDPALVSHPIWDEKLVNAETDPKDWLPEWFSEANALDPGRIERFDQRKRAFYFFHVSGEELINLNGDVESDFANFLDNVVSSQRDSIRTLIRKMNRFFGDETGSDDLKVWQSHRYNQSSKAILYSAFSKKRQEFEIVSPDLIGTLQTAFNLPKDHILLRLKSNKRATLRIDFGLFEMLSQAENGIPLLFLENELTRRVWQFMEQLSEPIDIERNDEVAVRLLDPVSNEILTVSIDTERKQYISIVRKE
ncbi:MAG TPA: DUF4338 domain-containing protein [bacterium]|nr:DUF4338 domain-containing protein [bacterium]